MSISYPIIMFILYCTHHFGSSAFSK